MSRVLIVGATSGIAEACARRWAERGDTVVLVARDAARLAAVTTDLKVRGAADVEEHCLDLRETGQLATVLEQCFSKPVDVALIAHGTLPDQSRCQEDVEYCLSEFNNNASSAIALLTLAANYLEQQGNGQLVYLSSVAADRGRPSNYLYGSAKAAVTTFCEGLRVRLFRSGVNVLTVKPGFVDTAMTRGLELPAALTVSPEKVARDIHRAIDKRAATLYTPWFWWPVMTLIRCLPLPVFKRLDL